MVEKFDSSIESKLKEINDEREGKRQLLSSGVQRTSYHDEL